ncbi:hypothetical protein BVG19_g4308 [[Candida] boidinii]|nr:hypothetical protein BVG19_g4308 [[Candida] boidinii]OWB51297.1 hypothetical protein B5S27_g2857 [[Candida] boidinii]
MIQSHLHESNSRSISSTDLILKLSDSILKNLPNLSHLTELDLIILPNENSIELLKDLDNDKGENQLVINNFIKLNNNFINKLINSNLNFKKNSFALKISENSNDTIKFFNNLIKFSENLGLIIDDFKYLLVFNSNPQIYLVNIKDNNSPLNNSISYKFNKNFNLDPKNFKNFNLVKNIIITNNINDDYKLSSASSSTSGNNSKVLDKYLKKRQNSKKIINVNHRQSLITTTSFNDNFNKMLERFILSEFRLRNISDKLNSNDYKEMYKQIFNSAKFILRNYYINNILPNIEIMYSVIDNLFKVFLINV